MVVQYWSPEPVIVKTHLQSKPRLLRAGHKVRNFNPNFDYTRIFVSNRSSISLPKYRVGCVDDYSRPLKLCALLLSIKSWNPLTEKRAVIFPKSSTTQPRFAKLCGNMTIRYTVGHLKSAELLKLTFDRIQEDGWPRIFDLKSL